MIFVTEGRYCYFYVRRGKINNTSLENIYPGRGVKSHVINKPITRNLAIAKDDPWPSLRKEPTLFRTKCGEKNGCLAA